MKNENTHNEKWWDIYICCYVCFLAGNFIMKPRPVCTYSIWPTTPCGIIVADILCI